MPKRLAFICVLSLVLGTTTRAQNVNDFLRTFGTVVQEAARLAAQAEWQKLPPSEISCLEQSLRSQGGSVSDLTNRGVFPSDPRLSQTRATCLNQVAQGPQQQTSPYVVDGLPLGGQVSFGSILYKQYQCVPSEKFSGFTWCHKEETKRDGGNEITLAHSILHTRDGTAWYVNRYVEPAFFGPTDIKTEIDRLSAKFGERPREYQMPQRADLPNALIAAWGKVQLEPLNENEMSVVATSSGSPKGILVGYLGDLQRSAKAGVPVYRLGGGAGFVYAATFNHNGRGVLRFLAIDASQTATQMITTNNPTLPSPVQMPKEDQKPVQAELEQQKAQVWQAEAKAEQAKAEARQAEAEAEKAREEAKQAAAEAEAYKVQIEEQQQRATLAVILLGALIAITISVATVIILSLIKKAKLVAAHAEPMQQSTSHQEATENAIKAAGDQLAAKKGTAEQEGIAGERSLADKAAATSAGLDDHVDRKAVD
jgi:hypothetical protein